MFWPMSCNCGETISLHHLVKGCESPPNALDAVRALQAAHGLQTQEFLKPHPTLGELPMRTLVKALTKPEVSKWC